MKRTIMILAAIALVLGLPQCKKQTTGVLEGNVEISLDVSAHKGSRIDVNPDTGDVAFEQNDVVYVASGGKFVGILTCRGTEFKGQITNPTLGEPLYLEQFDFLPKDERLDGCVWYALRECFALFNDVKPEEVDMVALFPDDKDFTATFAEHPIEPIEHQ